MQASSRCLLAAPLPQPHHPVSTFLHTNLKKLRTVRKASADMVSNAMGIKRSTWSGWENGTAEPSLEVLARIGDYYRISIDILLRTDLSTSSTFYIEQLQRDY